ncbi:hypothetical protein B296_00052074, partial [Ensete ventricosum]
MNATNINGISGPPTASIMAAKIYEERMKQPQSMDTAISSQFLDGNRVALLRSATNHPGYCPMFPLKFYQEQGTRKRKSTSSGAANSAGMPSANSPPSTPSIHTTGDGVSMASNLQSASTMSKSLMMYGVDRTGGLASSNQMVVLWNMDTMQTMSSSQEHSHIITDVCFRPNSSQLATSSFDKTVRLWNAAEVCLLITVIILLAARFKEPRRQSLWASARVKPGDRTRLLALLRSFVVDFGRQRSIEGEINVGGRLREKSIVSGQLREKKRRRKRGEEERRRGYIPPFPPLPSPRPHPRVILLPREETGEKDRGDIVEPAPSSLAHRPHPRAILLPREEMSPCAGRKIEA